MYSLKALAVAAAFAGQAMAKCDKYTIKDSNPDFDSCSKIDGDVTVDKGVAGTLQISTVKEITGDLIVNNASGLLGISSDSLGTIGGKFQLEGLNGLNTIQMDSLREVKELELTNLPQLRSLSFGNEELEASTVSIQDTWLSDLSGLMLSTVDTLNIDNNSRLTKFDSALVNVTEELFINANGNNMQVSMKKLENAKDVRIRNVASFDVPALESIDASLRFDNCDFKSFQASNLTSVKQSLAFINNEELKNVSLPALQSVGADFRLVNNTVYKNIDGFPKLTKAASIDFGGAFTDIDLPKLDSVSGTTVAATSSKEDTFCKWFNDNSDPFKVTPKCTYDNENAKNGGESSGGSTTDATSSDGSSGDSAAGMVTVNSALAALGLLAGLAQFL